MLRSIACATTVALLVLAGPARADSLPSEDMGACKVYSQMAGAVMSLRQMGAKMSDLMESHNGKDEGLVRRFIADAFDTPRYGGEKARQDAAVDFENKIYADCIKQKVN